MKLRLFSYLCSAAAVAALFLGTAHAVVLWNFTSVKSSFGGLPGATGDGFNDDTAAINRAISAATSPNGGVVYFPPGKYKYVGPMAVPANTAFRLYGDGPGVSTIVFTGTPSAGIDAHNRGNSNLQVDGLTLKANSNCGAATAIYAGFNETPPAKFRSATIRNVEIMGSERSNNPTAYWGNGISLFQAQNALIEDVQVHGKYDYANQGPTAGVGIHWAGSAPVANYPTTQAFLHNIYVDFFQVAVQTDGWVEGFYMSKFELVFCGYPASNSHAAMELTGTTGSNQAVPVFHISDGHINQISAGIRMNNINGIKISHVDFFNQLYDGTHVELTNCQGVSLIDNSFSDYGASQTISNGIYVISTNVFPATPSSASIIMSGNTFSHMSQTGGGACIALTANCTKIKILDTLFGVNEALHKYALQGADAAVRELP